MSVEISSDKKKQRPHDIQQMLSRTYWCPDINTNEVRKSIKNSSFVAGAFNETGEQIGFMRVVSDKVRFAYILDVVVREDCRGQGIATKMVRFAMSHPEMKDVHQWVLRTREASAVYSKIGFGPLESPEKWMEIRKPRPDRSGFRG
jgi:GNAT superfamily N-acetyltransferase